MIEEKEISNEEINSLPINWFKGKIEIIETPEEANKAVEKLLQEDFVGFDTESKPTFIKGKTNKNPIALMQFSNANTAYLFRINTIGVTDSICNLLEDEHTQKIGVALHSDMDKFKQLKKGKTIQTKGFVDLQIIAKHKDVKNLGLKKLAGIFLGFRISKKYQLSNWERNILSEPQKRYAATDAWVCYELFKVFQKQAWV